MVMRREHNGFVLLILLIFLQLFALLSAQYLMNKAQFKKQLRQEAEVIRARDLALSWLAKWGKKDVHCNEFAYPVKFLLQQNDSWWQVHACYVNDKPRIYFLKEDLQTDACAAIAMHDIWRVHFYRHTVYIPGKTGVMLQETAAVSDTLPIDCKQPIRTLTAGRQTLRWIR